LKTARSYRLRAEIPLQTAREVGWRVLMSGRYSTVIGYNAAARKLFFDRTQSGVIGFNKDFPVRTEAPLILATPTLRLDMLVDRSSVEVFADGGLVASTNLVFPEVGASGLEMYANGGETGPISVEISRLQSIWK
jgi:sucrose-6-phosphate hydrolase SacC (GH32 family)